MQTVFEAAGGNDGRRLYNVDPRFIIALAGAESTFGQNITWGQYNAWNWGWNTKNQKNSPFSCWASGIQSVTRGASGSYIHNPRDPRTDTTAFYAKYCKGYCSQGLDNLNTFLTEQGGDTENLEFPCNWP